MEIINIQNQNVCKINKRNEDIQIGKVEEFKNKQENDKLYKFHVTKLFFLILMHYGDLISDIFLPYQNYQQRKNFKGQSQTFLVTQSLFQLFGVIWDRYHQYQITNKLMEHMQQQQLQKNQQQNQEIRKQNNNNVKSLILVILLVEPFQYVKYYRQCKQYEKIKKIWFKKQLSELYYRNFYFFALGLTLVMIDLVKKEVPNKIIVFQVITSLYSCLNVLLQYHGNRMKKQLKYQQYNSEHFKQFPKRLQAFLINPGEFQSLKVFGINKKEDKNLLKKQNQKQYQQNKYNKIPLKINIIKCLSILILLVCEQLLVQFQLLSKFCIRSRTQVFIGILLQFPLVLKYWRIKYQQIKSENNSQNNKQIRMKFMKELIFGILKLPLYGIILGTQLMLPYVQFELPFIKQSRGTLVSNTSDSRLIFLYKILQSTYFMYISSQVVLEQKYHNPYMVGSDFSKEFISDPQDWFRVIYYVQVVLYIFLVVIYIELIVQYSCFWKEKSGSKQIRVINQQRQNLDLGLQTENIMESEFISDRQLVDTYPGKVLKNNSSIISFENNNYNTQVQYQQQQYKNKQSCSDIVIDSQQFNSQILGEYSFSAKSQFQKFQKSQIEDSLPLDQLNELQYQLESQQQQLQQNKQQQQCNLNLVYEFKCKEQKTKMSIL